MDFSEIQALIPIAIGILWVLGQIAGVFKREKPEERPRPRRDTVASPEPSQRRPRPPRPPRPPRTTRATPATPGPGEAPVGRRQPAPARSHETAAPPAPARARPAPPALRTGPAAPPPRPTMGVPEVFERPTRDPRLGTPDRPAKIARVAMPEARVGAKGARPVGPGRVTTARRPARAADAAAVAATEVSRVGAVDRPRRRRRGLSEAERILRVLRSRSGTRAAVQMAEILAPPVALRDDHLRR